MQASPPLAPLLPPERWNEIDELFAAALERPAAERAVFVEQSSGSDTQLAREVKALLDSAGAAEALLGESATSFAAPLLSVLHDELAAGADEAFAAGSRLGPYRIIEELGRGGMGAVYLAERADDTFEKRVAIKLVKRGMDTEEVLRRFRHERQILASLEHPHIARLYDGGVSDGGRSYLVMEYIRGQPLTAYCDERRLGIEERLRLFQTVCEAVRYAHQNLVVHRDLKPSNILVTGEGTVKLLDFGIAKLLDATTPPTAPTTRASVRVLTPEYASPEQLRGLSVTTASDIYALGVVLYELLTGQRPHARAGWGPLEAEWMALAEEVEPPSAVVARRDEGVARGARGHPSPPLPDGVAAARGTTPDRLWRRLRGDLDTIVCKALAKEPERRYQSAEQLLEDLRRHLEGLPVTARRHTVAYRAAKFVRRHRAGVLAASLAVLSLAGGLGAALWQGDRAARERDVAERERQNAEQERQNAEQVGAFLVELFTTSDPQISRGDAVTARELLDKGAERVGREAAGQPEVRARMMDAIGQAYVGLGLYDRARRLLEDALAIRRQVHGGDHPEVAASLYNLAYLEREQGRLGKSEPLFRESLAMRRRLFGSEHLDVVTSLNGLGYLLRSRGDFAEAAALYREALTTGRKLFDHEHPQIAESLNGLAVALFRQGDPGRAEPLLREALRMRRAIFGDDHPTVGMVIYNLGRVRRERGDLEAAERLHRAAMAHGRNVRGDGHPLMGVFLMGLADVLRDKGDLHAAESLYHQALQIQRRALPEGHHRTATTLIGFGQLLISKGRPRDAEPLVREALAISRANLVSSHFQIADAESVLGACLSAQGRFDEAEPLLTGSYRRLQVALGANDNRTRVARERLVEHYRRSGRPDRIMLLAGGRTGKPRGYHRRTGTP